MNKFAYIFHPSLVAKRILRRMPGLSVQTRLDLDLFPRPYYAYGVHQAARQAKRLGKDRMSVIEFGVAGGTGLLALEYIAEEIGRHVGITIDVYGFDTGEGLPAPADPRDLPYIWKKGFYKLDADRLRARLRRAKLILGLVSETVADFERQHAPAPVGFVSFDLDFYYSTRDAMKLFDALQPQNRLPRVFCYFDDIIGPDEELHGEHAGALLAIREFNDAHSSMKLSPIHGLKHKRIFHSAWCELQTYVLHDFAHPQYTRYLSDETEKQLPLAQ